MPFRIPPIRLDWALRLAQEFLSQCRHPPRFPDSCASAALWHKASPEFPERRARPKLLRRSTRRTDLSSEGSLQENGAPSPRAPIFRPENPGPNVLDLLGHAKVTTP